jgi:hypothetical protein
MIIHLSLKRWILPVVVLGKAAKNSIQRDYCRGELALHEALELVLEGRRARGGQAT